MRFAKASPFAAFAAAACLSASASAADLEVKIQDAPGVLTPAPRVDLASDRIRVSGLICRTPAAARSDARRLVVEVLDRDGAVLGAEILALSGGRFAGGRRCQPYWSDQARAAAAAAVRVRPEA